VPEGPTKHLVAAKLQELIDRLDQADAEVTGKLSRAAPSRVIQIDVSDLDASFWTELTEGRMRGLNEGSSPDVDIRITTESQTLVDMIDGRRSLFSSYALGHVRIDASMADLFALRRLL
jgi:predicted lipid carrier protein YhbT